MGNIYFQCIAATTLDEHRMHFEKDKALNRRFQPVFVDEPSQVKIFSFESLVCICLFLNHPYNIMQEDAVKILLGLRENYETYHKCKFTLEAINAAVYLSARYIPDRQLPDKAIDRSPDKAFQLTWRKKEKASARRSPPAWRRRWVRCQDLSV